MIKERHFGPLDMQKWGSNFEKLALNSMLKNLLKMPSKMIGGLETNLGSKSISKVIIDFDYLSGSKSIWGFATDLDFGENFQNSYPNRFGLISLSLRSC